MRSTAVVNGVPVVIGDAMMLFKDRAGGIAAQSKNHTVFFGTPNGPSYLPMTVGDFVTPHSLYDQHSVGVPMATGSPTVYIHGSKLCGEGHLAACEHSASGTTTTVISQLD